MAYVMLADDCLQAIKPVEHCLSRLGHRLLTVTDGRKCLEQLTAELPDVLVMDLLLPYMDAFFLLDELARRRSISQMRIIVLTTVDATGEPTHDWTMPVDAYVLAPYSTWQLVMSVEQVIFRTVIRPT